MKIFQAIILILAMACIGLSIIGQSYRYGQRHPPLEEMMSYQNAVKLANDRELFGYDSGYEAGWADAKNGKALKLND